MKKFLIAIIIIITIMGCGSNVALSEKSLEVTITGYSVLYQMCMEALGQKTNIRREWMSANQAMIYLTDTSFCTVTTESQNDFSNIIEALHTSTIESDSDMLSIRCSMVSTIMAFDPQLDTNTITDMVMNILPGKGEYTSNDCKYKYVKSYNVIMLYISRR